jgi:very-short-patch-repair endonuclease
MARDVSRLNSVLIEELNNRINLSLGMFESYCESPIEVMLAAAMYWSSRISCDHDSLYVAHHSDIDFIQRCRRILIPQYPWREYRIDFLLRDGPFEVFIECDGHDFHERTKEQAARDRQKDREMQSKHPVLRFTGSEIFHNPLNCADQIFLFISDLYTPTAAREV